MSETKMTLGQVAFEAEQAAMARKAMERSLQCTCQLGSGRSGVALREDYAAVASCPVHGS